MIRRHPAEPISESTRLELYLPGGRHYKLTTSGRWLSLIWAVMSDSDANR